MRCVCMPQDSFPTIYYIVHSNSHFCCSVFLLSSFPLLQLEKTIRLLRERLTEKQTVAMDLKTQYNLS
jgi:hypothetical protein